MSSAPEVHLDLDLCQGYANCVIAAPDVFDIDDATGVAVLLEPTPSPDRRSAVEEAVRNCPASAISIRD